MTAKCCARRARRETTEIALLVQPESPKHRPVRIRAKIALLPHGARKDLSTVRAMQDSLLDLAVIALFAAWASTKPQSDLANAHCVHSENTVGVSHLGKPARTHVLLVARAHLHLARERTVAQFAPRARIRQPRERAFACSVLSVHGGLQRR